MKSVNFNTGVKRYAINGDESNVIAVNINDVNIVKRLEECQKKLDSMQEEFKTIGTPTSEQLSEYDRQIKKLLDYSFGTDISAHAFGEMNCLSPTEDDELVCMNFLNAFLPIVLEDIKKFSNNVNPKVSKKVAAYTTFNEPASSAPKNPIDLFSLNDKQRAYLESLS